MPSTIKKGDIQLVRVGLSGGPVAQIDILLPTGLECIGHVELRTGTVVPAPGYGQDFLAAVLHIAGLTADEVQHLMNTPH